MSLSPDNISPHLAIDNGGGSQTDSDRMTKNIRFKVGSGEGDTKMVDDTEGGIHRSFANGIPAIDFSERIQKILFKEMELTSDPRLEKLTVSDGQTTTEEGERTTTFGLWMVVERKNRRNSQNTGPIRAENKEKTKSGSRFGALAIKECGVDLGKEQDKGNEGDVAVSWGKLKAAELGGEISNGDFISAHKIASSVTEPVKVQVTNVNGGLSSNKHTVVSFKEKESADDNNLGKAFLQNSNNTDSGTSDTRDG
ncbi:hypothetical protein J1N35_007122 [Gossypium stocksii]|uniref:Uncharacterized protein n=1 Tax=Gossypium stocksii TaxID=47602 RepID=A0A9D4AEZ6_9ROSI|nr:hypothetical protein J1N35_007122 [Gossypium stocksii]